MIKSAFTNGATATGTAALHLPDGPERDEILGLLRLGVAFNKQHSGKKPGALSRLVLDCARRGGPPYSFAQLLYELQYEAASRQQHGERASPVEKLDRAFQLVTIHLPKQGRRQIDFRIIRNHLTKAKKIIKKEIHPNP